MEEKMNTSKRTNQKTIPSIMIQTLRKKSGGDA